MELYFKEFRPKSPVVILHGLFGFSDNWQTIAKALSEDQTVLTPDLRNHGRSPHVNTHSYPEMAEDLKKFLEQRKISQAVIIGHSMGGKAAMQLAMNYPDLVEKLVIIDMEPGQAADNHREIFKALFDLDFSVIKTRQEANDFLSSRIEDEGTRQFLLKNITRETSGEFAWKMNLPVLWKDYHNILAPVTGKPYEKSALFIRGGKSNYIKDEEITLIEEYFPKASVVTIEGAGHWVHADKPAELLAVLKGFLE
jgi:esterase